MAVVVVEAAARVVSLGWLLLPRALLAHMLPLPGLVRRMLLPMELRLPNARTTGMVTVFSMWGCRVRSDANARSNSSSSRAYLHKKRKVM